MWIWILIIFIVVGAILGLLSSGDKEGCFGGALMGLFEGGSCLFQLFIIFILVMIACWIFG